MAVMQKLIVIGFLFLATLATGIWLSSLGKPLSPSLSAIHKLLALACVIFAAIRTCHAVRLTEPSTAQFTMIAVLGVSAIMLFVSGALLTVPRFQGAVWLNMHRIASGFAVVAFAVTTKLFILSKR